jgi:hypothetical protein
MSSNCYNKGKIYKIVDNTNGNIYIGSTCKTLSGRLSSHRGAYKSYLKTGKCYLRSIDILKNGDYEIILIEEVNCENKDQLNKRERYYIDTLTCVNKNVPTRTNAEYVKDNEELKVKRKLYYDANKENLVSKQKEYYLANIERNKEYRNKNKDKFLLPEIKESRNAKRREEFVCECGQLMTVNSKYYHLKSNRHKNNMALK